MSGTTASRSGNGAFKREPHNGRTATWIPPPSCRARGRPEGHAVPDVEFRRRPGSEGIEVSIAGDGAGGIDLRLLQAAVEAAGEAILITTADLDEPGPTILYANPAFVRLTGYHSEEAVGRSPRFLQGPRTERAALDAARGSLTAGEAFQGRHSTTARTARPTGSSG
ncbi:PAS domain-containing protein (plasmid) [Methylobacterium oryzae CBMB20]